MWLISGKIDCQFRWTSVGDYTLFMKNA